VTLIDTAGQRPAAAMSGLERAGHQMGNERTAQCDVIVQVIDLSRHDDQLSLEAPLGKSAESRAIVVANKIDLLADSACAARVAELRRKTGLIVVPTCAISGTGLDQLRGDVLREVLGDQRGDGQLETVQVTQKRQHEALLRAASALRDGLAALQGQAAAELVVEHTREALAALGQITGETYTEDVLDAVFSRFCIGK
jgi:tRNA modification GTPase